MEEAFAKEMDAGFDALLASGLFRNIGHAVDFEFDDHLAAFRRWTWVANQLSAITLAEMRS